MAPKTKKHTAPPWQYYDGCVTHVLTGNVIADLQLDRMPNDANGEFIVLAVNSHAALVKALKLVVYDLANGPPHNVPVSTMRKIFAALAKVNDE